MKAYRITKTTDRRYIGYRFFLNEEEKTITVMRMNGPKVYPYRDIKFQGKGVRVYTANYALVGKEV